MYYKVIRLDAGPATLIPLAFVPLLKKAPIKDNSYKSIEMYGERCHFYGDFSGFHIYLIASTFKKRIVENSLNYYDKKNGFFSLTLEITKNSGETQKIPIDKCRCPLYEINGMGLSYPYEITIENHSIGTPDGLKFHFPNQDPKFRFSSSLIPEIPEEVKLNYPGVFDLKVEYIGKAVGQEGSREIADRLGNGHSVETAILNEFNYRKTNLDLFAILYKPGILTDGHNGPKNTAITFSQTVDILEKSLIAHFSPERNSNSKNFPRDASEPAKLLIQSGVSNLWVTADSPKEYGLLYSDKVDREVVHRFDLKLPNYG